MPQAYIRGFLKVPYDTRSYMSAVSALFDEAVAEIGSGWTKDDVTFIDSGSFITMFIVY